MLKAKRPDGVVVEITHRAFDVVYKSLGFTLLEEATKPTNEMTTEELKKGLKERGIDIPKGAKKAELLELLADV